MISRAALRLNLVGAEAFLGEQTIRHRIGERGGMAAGFPDFRVHDDGGFQADDVVAPAGHGLPPGLLDVAFEFRAQRAVIPKAVDAAVNFGGLKNEPAPFAQRDNPFHQIIGFGLHHRSHSFLEGAGDVKEAGMESAVKGANQLLKKQFPSEVGTPRRGVRASRRDAPAKRRMLSHIPRSNHTPAARSTSKPRSRMRCSL